MATQVIASALVELKAETAHFRRDFAAARQETLTFQKSLVSVGESVKNTVAGFVSLQAAIGLIKSIGSATMEAEQATFRLDAVLKATGHSAGMTLAQIESLATAMQGTTLFDDEEVKNAAAALATFSNVSGDAFARTLKLAGDLSTVFGGDLQSNAVKLGKALDDPVDGVTSLGKMLGKLSPAEKEHIENLVEMGRLEEAQGVILDKVTAKVHDAADALGERGLTGAVNQLSDAWHDFEEQAGDGDSILGKILIGSTQLLTFNLKKYTGQFEEAKETAAQFTAELQAAVAVKGLPTITSMGEGPEARKKRLAEEKKAATELRAIKKDYWAGVIADDKRGADAEVAITKWLDDQAEKSADADAKRAEERHRIAEDQLAFEMDLANSRYAEEVRQAEQVQKVWTHAVQRISDQFADTFADLLTGQIKSFQDFAASILSIWARTMAQMAGAKLASSIFGGLLQSGASAIAPPSFGGFDIPNPLGAAAMTNHVTVNVAGTNASPAQIAGAVVSALNSRGMSSAVARRLS